MHVLHRSFCLEIAKGRRTEPSPQLWQVYVSPIKNTVRKKTADANHAAVVTDARVDGVIEEVDRKDHIYKRRSPRNPNESFSFGI